MPTIIHGDCIEAMREMPENSIDSIVTDPPYGLGFMGKKWDDLPPGREWAEECLRVLKPGGHLLAFGGTRTWHRLATSIEDAGFEMRDSIAWLYGSGFPKNKATLKPAFEPIVMARKPFKGSLAANESINGTGALNIDASRIATTDSLAGGASTVGMSSETRHEGWARPWMNDLALREESRQRLAANVKNAEALGRWPANVILDESMAEVLDEQSGVLVSGTRRPSVRAALSEYATNHNTETTNGFTGDWGGASRFFYVAKAPKKERPVVDGIAHPTVKPLALMRHLVKLVTPAGGTVLEPFAGSGATVEACMLEGFDCIAIEREAEYLPLIHQRIERAA